MKTTEKMPAVWKKSLLTCAALGVLAMPLAGCVVEPVPGPPAYAYPAYPEPAYYGPGYGYGYGPSVGFVFTGGGYRHQRWH